MEIQNRQIVAFFAKNPEIDPETVLRQFMERHSKPMEYILADLFPMGNISTTFENNREYVVLRRVCVPYNLVFDAHCARSNVNCEQVAGFVESLRGKENVHGICLSHESGVEARNNFSHEVVNESGNLVVFLHRAGYDASKILAAVELLDALLSRYDILKTRTDETFLQIQKEYTLFFSQKEILCNILKANRKRELELLEGIKIGVMERFFAGSLLPVVFRCEVCDEAYPCSRALSAHQRGKCREKLEDATKRPKIL